MERIASAGIRYPHIVSSWIARRLVIQAGGYRRSDLVYHHARVRQIGQVGGSGDAPLERLIDFGT